LVEEKFPTFWHQDFVQDVIGIFRMHHEKQHHPILLIEGKFQTIYGQQDVNDHHAFQRQNEVILFGQILNRWTGRNLDAF
jgi:hypothetical protein